MLTRRRPSYVFFGTEDNLAPKLDTDTHGRLITLGFLDYIVFYLYAPAKPEQMLPFYQKLTQHVTNTKAGFALPCILLGDLNCPFTKDNISESTPWLKTWGQVDYEPCRQIIRDLITLMNVQDTTGSRSSNMALRTYQEESG